MTTLSEIERAAEQLCPEEQEALIRFLGVQRGNGQVSVKAYSTRTHPGRVRDGLDAQKLGQVPDDF